MYNPPTRTLFSAGISPRSAHTQRTHAHTAGTHAGHRAAAPLSLYTAHLGSAPGASLCHRAGHPAQTRLEPAPRPPGSPRIPKALHLAGIPFTWPTALSPGRQPPHPAGIPASPPLVGIPKSLHLAGSSHLAGIPKALHLAGSSLTWPVCPNPFAWPASPNPFSWPASPHPSPGQQPLTWPAAPSRHRLQVGESPPAAARPQQPHMPTCPGPSRPLRPLSGAGTGWMPPSPGPRSPRSCRCLT